MFRIHMILKVCVKLCLQHAAQLRIQKSFQMCCKIYQNWSPNPPKTYQKSEIDLGGSLEAAGEPPLCRGDPKTSFPKYAAKHWGSYLVKRIAFCAQHLAGTLSLPVAMCVAWRIRAPCILRAFWLLPIAMCAALRIRALCILRAFWFLPVAMCAAWRIRAPVFCEHSGLC